MAKNSRLPLSATVLWQISRPSGSTRGCWRKLVTARTVSTSAAAAFRPWGGVMARRRTWSVLTEVQDVEAVIRYAQSLPYTSNTLLLMGCSQGGMVSALTAAKHPDAVDRLVLFYPGILHPRRRARGAHDDGALRPSKPAGEDSLRADAAGSLLSPKPSYTWTFSAKSRRTPGGC